LKQAALYQLVTEMKTLIVCFFLLLLHSLLKAQIKTPSLKHFLEGSWKGEGKFANGKEIAATASFKWSLDSCWLIYTHEDLPPNRYKAISLWSVDRSKQSFSVDIFDNFHGHRLFAGIQPSEDEVILNATDTLVKATRFFQRFVYTKLDDHRFKMSYEVSKDNVNWQLGDSLVFIKIQ